MELTNNNETRSKNKELFEDIMSGLSDKLINNFGLKKTGSKYTFKGKGVRKEVVFNHHIDKWSGELIISPAYDIKYDVLENWFSKFSFRSKSDQKTSYSFGFVGEMIGYNTNYFFRLDEDNQSAINKFHEEVLSCTEYVFTNYGTLPSAYKNRIEPILNEELELPINGFDWAMIDLTLCKIVNPNKYSRLKEIILDRIRFLNKREEPNVAYYYDKIDDILRYLESLSTTDLENHKIIDSIYPSWYEWHTSKHKK